jgi:hypothetical protein
VLRGEIPDFEVPVGDEPARVVCSASENRIQKETRGLSRCPTSMSTVSTPVENEPERAPDRELADLPAPRRPWRRATLTTLSVALAASLALSAAVFPDVRYALGKAPPRELGELSGKRLGPELGDTWVHGVGQLSVTNAIRYRRPLESDSYRLASVEGNPKLWVQIRVPAGEEDPRFVPPDSFVGRLLPVSKLGVRQRGLREAVGDSGLAPPADDAWLLVDGESPASVRWALGLFGLLLAFAAFNGVGLFRLARSIPTSSGRTP